MEEVIQISLPAPLKAFLAERVAAGGYASESAYIGALLDNEQQHLASRELETLLLEGLNSSSPRLFTTEVLDQVRQQVHQRIADTQKQHT